MLSFRLNPRFRVLTRPRRGNNARPWSAINLVREFRVGFLSVVFDSDQNGCRSVQRRVYGVRSNSRSPLDPAASRRDSENRGSRCSYQNPTEDSRAALAISGDKFEGHIRQDRKSTRLNSSHVSISYAVFCLKKKKIQSHLHCIHVYTNPRVLHS